MKKIKETENQVNYGWGLSLNMTGKAPAITKRIWDKLSDAQAYVDLSTESAIAGLTLRVVNDTEDKNGVYWVKQAAGEQIFRQDRYDKGERPAKDDPKHKNGILVKLADENDVHDDFVNVTGDTMTGNLTINNGGLTVTGATSIKGDATINGGTNVNGKTTIKGDTTISGGTIDIDGSTKVDITTPLYNLTGTTTNMEGNKLTAKYNTIDLSGNTVNISGNTILNIDSPDLNIKSEDMSISGNNLSVTEKNTTINSTDKFAVNSNNVNISGTTTTLKGTDLTLDYNKVNVSGDTTISKTLNVSGATHLGDTLTVDGVTNLNNNLNVSGNTTIDKNITVKGTANISGATHLGDTLVVDGETTINNKLNVSGDTHISGNTTIDKNLTVSGDTHIKGNTVIDKNLTVSGNTEIKGDLILPEGHTINGELTYPLIFKKGSVKSFSEETYKNKPATISDNNEILIPTNTSHINIDSITITHDTAKEQQTNVREAYKLMGNNVQLGDTITIYKDSSLKTVKLGKADAKINTSTGAFTSEGTAQANDALLFVYHQEDGKYSLVAIDVEQFLKESEFKNGLQVVGGEVSVKRDTNQVDTKYLTVTDKGVGLSGITEEITKQFNIADKLENTIKVTGVNVGNLTNGKEVVKGTSIEELLRQMLMRTIGVSFTKPSVSISSNISSETIYEVGTTVAPTISHSYSDGYFYGAEKDYSYHLNAGCKETKTTYYLNSVALSIDFSHKLTEQSITYNCKTSYAQSTAKPVNNMGKETGTVIPAGTATSGNIIYYGRYKYFLGYINKTSGLTSSEVRGLTTRSSWVNPSSNVTIVGESAIKSNGGSIVVSVPEGYRLIKITNGVGADILPNFKTIEKTSVTLQGGVNKTYNTYIYPITNGAIVEFKNVIIGK